MDVFSPRKRSLVMARIRGGDNRSTERRLAAMLRARGIAGWTLRAPDVVGRPDVYFTEARIAIFVDGCFWHACPRCFTMPRHNRAFWARKIRANLRRDRFVRRALRRAGVRVLRLWEHDVERYSSRVQRLLSLLLSVCGPRSVTGRSALPCLIGQ